MAKIRWNTHFKQCKNVKSKIFPLLLSYTSIKVGLQCHSRPTPPRPTWKFHELLLLVFNVHFTPWKTTNFIIFSYFENYYGVGY